MFFGSNSIITPHLSFGHRFLDWQALSQMRQKHFILLLLAVFPSIVGWICWIQGQPFTFGPPLNIAGITSHPFRLEIPPPQKIRISKTLFFWIVSAVPVFGEGDSYIALLTERPSDPLWCPSKEEKWSDLIQQVLFCSGPNRSHLSPISYRGSVLICPWPPEERQKYFFDVYLENAETRVLGSFVASHNPNFRGQYQIMACVRDLFEPSDLDKRKRIGAFSLLVQWMEWSLMNGVGHFLVYKFSGNDSIEEDILKPYLDAGVATMVYFEFCQNYHRTRHGHTINDCLFRAKSHAEWLMPVIDVDEYLYVPGGLVRSLKNSEGVFGSLDQVHSLEFKRIRFEKAPLDQLDISSTRYEPLLPQDPGWKNPKQFVHVDSVYRVSTHETIVFDKNKTGHKIDPETAVIHHYRFPFNKTGSGDANGSATATDESLLIDVAPLTEAIRRRFGLGNSPLDVQKLLQKLARTSPPNCVVQKARLPQSLLVHMQFVYADC